MYVDGAFLELGGVADAVDAADGADDDDVAAPAEQGRGGAKSQLVELVVDLKVFFNIGVGGWYVGLGLVVVVVGNEIFDGVVGEKLLELAIELRRQRLVVAHHQCGTVELCDDVGHGEGLAAARDTQQYLGTLAATYAVDQLLYGLGLVARRREIGFKLKVHLEGFEGLKVLKV